VKPVVSSKSWVLILLPEESTGGTLVSPLWQANKHGNTKKVKTINLITLIVCKVTI
jgi:hypothetical protein